MQIQCRRFPGLRAHAERERSFSIAEPLPPLLPKSIIKEIWDVEDTAVDLHNARDIYVDIYFTFPSNRKTAAKQADDELQPTKLCTAVWTLQAEDFPYMKRRNKWYARRERYRVVDFNL